MSSAISKQEYWLSGPIDGVPDLLQPVAHALLQARDEIQDVLQEFDDRKLWDRPQELASVGFHLQHITGVLDRLFTYSRGESLSAEQLNYLSREGQKDGAVSLSSLLSQLSAQVSKSIEFLKTVDPQRLTDRRTVGRKQLPSTVMGLLFHSAEHTMRHGGQLRVTAKIVSN